MNSFERALLEKIGHDNGFENVLTGDPNQVRLGSARHRVEVSVGHASGSFRLFIKALSQPLLLGELIRAFPEIFIQEQGLTLVDHAQLSLVMRRAAELAHALPNQAASEYVARLEEELAKLPVPLKGTEVERLVRQRVGQDVFRQAMLDYWGGACAVTGLALSGVLRASHAKSWAKCDTDAERLDIFNGFLLNANLDALFDRYLISFDDAGKLLVSPEIVAADRCLLDIDRPMQLRWVTKQHLPYLAYQRELFGKLQQV